MVDINFTGYRRWLTALTNGDDDKPEDLAKSFYRRVVSQGTMGVPNYPRYVEHGYEHILAKRYSIKRNSVMALSIVEKFRATQL